MEKIRSIEIKWLTHVPQTHALDFKACPNGYYAIRVSLNKTLQLRTEIVYRASLIVLVFTLGNVVSVV